LERTPLDALCSMLRSNDRSVAEQGWELCAALALRDRRRVAARLLEANDWAQAARCLLPDAAPQQARLLRLFGISCVVHALPLLDSHPLLQDYCADTLAALRRVADERPSRALRQRLQQRGHRESRLAARQGPLPEACRYTLEATLALLRLPSPARAVSSASAMSRRAHREAAVARCADPARADACCLRWQQAQFFRLLLPVAKAQA